MALSDLSAIQNERLKRLELQLHLAAQKGDFPSAKKITIDIQNILRPAGLETKLMQVKNWLCEAAIESGEYEFAITTLQGIKLKTNKNTRVHLEATALLAISYLRSNNLSKAKPEIADVLKNDRVIKSLPKREEFHKSIIKRFDEEVTLFSLKNKGTDELNIDDINTLAITVERESSEDQIYNTMGTVVPQNVLDNLFDIDNFSKKQLPSAERLRLPAPEEEISVQKVGKTLFSSIKRTLYKSLCDQNSDIYKTWFDEGLKIVLNKKYITTAVVATFTGLGIGIKAIVVSVVALIIKFGIDVYCNHYKPDGVMLLRQQ